MKRFAGKAFGFSALTLLTLIPALVLAAPVVIDFEDLETGGVGTAGVATVRGQYAGKGIVFNDPTVLDYSKAIPGFAHSGSKAIEPCYSGEFCTTPIRMTFTTAQSRVKLWVGYRVALTKSVTVRMRSFNSADAVIDTLTTTLGPSSNPIPINKPLELISETASIVRVDVDVTAPDPTLVQHLAVDDIEFDTAGPPPPCPGTKKPTVQITAPLNGKVTQVNAFSLQAEFFSEDTLGTITITVQPATGTLHKIYLTAFTGTYGPYPWGGYLEAGTNTITARIQDCHGTAESTVKIKYEPILAGTKLKVDGMEVTQAIQSLNNDVPLIAGKRTVVRAYLHVEGPSKEIKNVRGHLHAARPDLSSPGGAYTVESLNEITLDTTTDTKAKRRDLNKSLNFELPPEWITKGKIHLGLVKFSVEGHGLFLSCEGCASLMPPITEPVTAVFRSFEEAPPVRLRIARVAYNTATPTGTTTHQAGQNHVDHLTSWLLRAYPTHQVDSTARTLTTFGSLPQCGDVNNALSTARSLDLKNKSVDKRAHYYGIVTNAGGFMRGCSNGIPSSEASGPTGVPGTTDWDTDGSWGDWYGAHELGHSYDRRHPGYCDGQGKDDKAYPYANGLISGADEKYFGFDVGDATLTIARQVYDPAVWTDVMTYCGNEWISDYTYKGLKAELKSLETRHSRASTRLTRADSEDTILIQGIMNLTAETVRLGTFLRVSGLPLSLRPAAGEYRIELLDAAGGLLAEYPFEPKLDTETREGEDQIAMLSEVVLYVAGTRRIVISKSRVELASREVSENAPAVRISKPDPGTTLDGSTAALEWEARDEDGDALTFTLLYSPDGGKSWQTIAVGVEGNRHPVNLNELAGSDTALFRIIASDGVNTASDDLDGPVRVPFKSPRVRIVSPPDASRFLTTQTVVFVGEANDLQDGLLSDGALQWSSDRQGVLGYGRSLGVSGLVPGKHTIVLAATNRQGKTGQASVTLEVTLFYLTDDRLPLPGGQQTWTYHGTSAPVRSADPAAAMPAAVGPVAAAGDTLNLQVALNRIAGAADLYLILHAPDIDPLAYFVIYEDRSLHSLFEGIAPWKRNTTGPIGESLYGNIPVIYLPRGNYFLYLILTPTRNPSRFYSWVTSFEVPVCWPGDHPACPPCDIEGGIRLTRPAEGEVVSEVLVLAAETCATPDCVSFEYNLNNPLWPEPRWVELFEDCSPEDGWGLRAEDLPAGIHVEPVSLRAKALVDGEIKAVSEEVRFAIVTKEAP